MMTGACPALAELCGGVAEINTTKLQKARRGAGMRSTTRYPGRAARRTGGTILHDLVRSEAERGEYDPAASLVQKSHGGRKLMNLSGRKSYIDGNFMHKVTLRKSIKRGKAAKVCVASWLAICSAGYLRDVRRRQRGSFTYEFCALAAGGRKPLRNPRVSLAV